MSEFMLWLSGVDRDTLSHCERERNKFVAMGGTVLTTAVLATLASTFTSHEFLHTPLIPALFLGFGWGLAIMNLDRWLLISIRRQATTAGTIAMAAPRIVLALLIGAVIAHPLVLRVFDKEINAQATRDKNEAFDDGRKDLRQQFAAVPQLVREAEQRRSDLTAVNNGAEVEEAPEYQEAAAELRRLEKREANAQHAALCELDGRCGSDKQGAGPAYDAKNAVAEGLREQVGAQRERVARIRSRLLEQESNLAGRTRNAEQRGVKGVEAKLGNLKKERDEKLAELKEDYDAEIGLLDRVVALDNLTFERPEMLVIEVLLFLFILAIDSMPAIAKVLMSLGRLSQYEITQTELEEADTYALKQQTQAHARASEREAELIVDEAETRRSLMKGVQDDLVKQASEAMREAGEKFISLWREAILARVPRLVRGELERNGMGDRKGAPPKPPASGNGSGGGSATRDPKG